MHPSFLVSIAFQNAVQRRLMASLIKSWRCIVTWLYNVKTEYRSTIPQSREDSYRYSYCRSTCSGLLDRHRIVVSLLTDANDRENDFHLLNGHSRTSTLSNAATTTAGQQEHCHRHQGPDHHHIQLEPFPSLFFAEFHDA